MNGNQEREGYVSLLIGSLEVTRVRISLAHHTPYSQRKRGLVTLHTSQTAAKLAVCVRRK